MRRLCEALSRKRDGRLLSHFLGEEGWEKEPDVAPKIPTATEKKVERQEKKASKEKAETEARLKRKRGDLTDPEAVSMHKKEANQHKVMWAQTTCGGKQTKANIMLQAKKKNVEAVMELDALCKSLKKARKITYQIQMKSHTIQQTENECALHVINNFRVLTGYADNRLTRVSLQKYVVDNFVRPDNRRNFAKAMNYSFIEEEVLAGEDALPKKRSKAEEHQDLRVQRKKGAPRNRIS